jgi:hypothetical protein
VIAAEIVEAVLDQFTENSRILSAVRVGAGIWDFDRKKRRAGIFAPSATENDSTARLHVAFGLLGCSFDRFLD